MGTTEESLTIITDSSNIQETHEQIHQVKLVLKRIKDIAEMTGLLPCVYNRWERHHLAATGHAG